MQNIITHTPKKKQTNKQTNQKGTNNQRTGGVKVTVCIKVKYSRVIYVASNILPSRWASFTVRISVDAAPVCGTETHPIYKTL